MAAWPSQTSVSLCGSALSLPLSPPHWAFKSICKSQSYAPYRAQLTWLRELVLPPRQFLGGSEPANRVLSDVSHTSPWGLEQSAIPSEVRPNLGAHRAQSSCWAVCGHVRLSLSFAGLETGWLGTHTGHVREVAGATVPLMKDGRKLSPPKFPIPSRQGPWHRLGCWVLGWSPFWEQPAEGVDGGDQQPGVDGSRGHRLVAGHPLQGQESWWGSGCTKAGVGESSQPPTMGTRV